MGKKRKTKEFWLRFRGRRTWHKVVAETKTGAIEAMLRGTTGLSKKDVISRKTRPPVKKGAWSYRIP